MIQSKLPNKTKFAALCLFFLLCFFGSFLLGKYPIDPWTLIQILFSQIFPLEPSWDHQSETILFQVRLPRILAAVLIGAALSGLLARRHAARNRSVSL